MFVGYTDDQLIKELHRVSTLLPAGPLTRAAVEQVTTISTSTMIRRFGGWRDALATAGLEDRYSGRSVTPKMRARHRPREKRTRDDIIAELRRVATAAGRGDIITQADVARHSSWLAAHAPTRLFGSWEAAVETAGLRRSKMSHRWSEDDLRANPEKLAWFYGRPPTSAETRLPPSAIAADTYRSRYCSWARARHLLLR